MKNRSAVFLLTAILLLTLSAMANGAVEGEVKKTLNLESPPLDLAASLNGQYIYVLTAQKNILVYSVEGKLEGKIPVESQVDSIKVGPWEDVILLTSKKNKQVQILLLDFIKDIDLSHSPFKGPADAPVEIAVFSDFQ
ncbi:MAG: hypothetical protein LJE88_18050 [Deltaproteobacteria bacterium]|nr:hypothetical protein [Deltaproteobacteria bacterium]